MRYLGDLAEDASVTFVWNTYDAGGASITRATDGTIKVRRDDATDCTGSSVTDSEDTPDTGIHECTIDTSDSANFAIGYDYSVWLDGAVIDGQTVNACLATFSIENRFAEVDVVKWLGQAVAATVNGRPSVDVQYILGHQLTQTGTQVADNFQTFFDVGTQTFTSGTALADFKATGFSTHTAANVYTAFGTGGNLTTCATAAGFNTVTPDAAGVAAGLLGTAGANLTDLGGMSTGMKAEVQAEALDALVQSSAVLVSTTIATLASQTSFTLTAGSADDSAYVGCMAIITDVSTAAQKAIGLVSAYTGATKTVTLKADPGIFTMAATDVIHILPVPKQLPAGIADGAGGLAISDAGGLDMDAILTAAQSAMSVTVSSTTVGEAPEVNVKCYQFGVIEFSFTCDDAQTGDTHQVDVMNPSDMDTILFSIPTGDITVGGSGDKTLTVADDDENAETAGVFAHRTWNTSDDKVVATGSFTILPNPDPNA